MRNALILFRDLQMYQTEMISAHVSKSTSDSKWRKSRISRWDFCIQMKPYLWILSSKHLVLNESSVNCEKIAKKLILLARNLYKTKNGADCGTRNKCKCKMCHAKQKQPTNITNRAIRILILSDVLHFSPIFWFVHIPLSPKPLSQLEFRIRKRHRIRYSHITVVKIEYNQI